MTKPGDYTYDIPLEDLKRYAALAPEEVLRWLEEYQQFLRMALSPKSRRIAELFKQGKI